MVRMEARIRSALFFLRYATPVAAPIAGSVILSSPVSMWPANSCWNPGSESIVTTRSRLTILRKARHLRAAFPGFDPAVVAEFAPADVTRLLGDAGIIRNRAKITAVIGNARAALAVPGGLAALVWSYAADPR